MIKEKASKGIYLEVGEWNNIFKIVATEQDVLNDFIIKVYDN